jgi:histidinol-phosphate aminotransferase
MYFRFMSYFQQKLAQQLREQGIIVRYFNKPRINQFLRITVGTDEQNQRLVDTLKTKIL